MSIGPILLDLQGISLSAEEQRMLNNPLVGGIILFTRNYHDRQQLSQLIKNIRTIRPELLITVDHEGGRVQRFREGFTLLPPLAEFGKLYSIDPHQALQSAKDSARLMASELLSIGIDFSLAPVLDVDQGISQVIGDRSFSADKNIVIELATAYIAGMHSVGMAATGKHFPGHGAVAPDSHHELPIDRRDLQSVLESDMLPFAKLSNRLDAIMPAHIVFPNIDKYPVGFSQFWLQEILRKRLHFNGVIISDDITMAGAAIIGNYLQRAEMALDAGCDLITLCNNRAGAWQVLSDLRYKPSTASAQRLIKMRGKL